MARIIDGGSLFAWVDIRDGARLIISGPGSRLSHGAVHVNVRQGGALRVNSGGSLYQYEMRLWGRLDVDSTAGLHLDGPLVFETSAELEAAPGTHMTIWSLDVRGAAPRFADPDLANVTFTFDCIENRGIEAASSSGGGFFDNFAFGGLRCQGPASLIDDRDNGNRGGFGQECVFTHTLSIEDGGSLDLNGLLLFVEGDIEAIAETWVAEGKLYDSVGGIVAPRWQPSHGWTVVPEPAALTLLAFGGPLAWGARRRRGNA